eukprot:CAMPEP_0115160490 /NCGR_PEP_ID=MMETSP0227-20121206/70842_1 /TAXON_ID=89957 /ORGANISM="Polarella glacialis, Strain CCMP 1383" /LENGTH=44 /DNA_ID= /DNA_START= /DNA_END= /DNA_ORIENTATION=
MSVEVQGPLGPTQCSKKQWQEQAVKQPSETFCRARQKQSLLGKL